MRHRVGPGHPHKTLLLINSTALVLSMVISTTSMLILLPSGPRSSGTNSARPFPVVGIPSMRWITSPCDKQACAAGLFGITCMIAAKIVFATAAKVVQVHALDGAGARTGEVPSTLAAGKLSFEIGPRFRTLWYEVVAE
jgi:hypothetical protein